VSQFVARQLERFWHCYGECDTCAGVWAAAIDGKDSRMIFLA